MSLNRWEVIAPNNSSPKCAVEIQSYLIFPQQRGGALAFTKRLGGGGDGGLAYVFSSVGYDKCILNSDGSVWQVSTTFGFDRNYLTLINANFVEIGEDGSAMFVVNAGSGSRGAVAIFPPTGYAYIRYAGAANAEEES
ncbi:hypothetical protein JOH50_006658 [Rhizobium leguminosarum]|uniref:hypothetical protein n=1 Tax=Rhizobium leguminosarum TaxID=384 RepID=UPI001AEB0CD0|nr:hypothetical protein [Rhizobium leguminosarum]MBP2490862.1 hypothetical protein [Rhizobium leguminosarum]